MGRKVWLCIIAALAILLALVVTAVIWLGTMDNEQQPTEPETSGVQKEETQEQTDAQQTQAEATEDSEVQQVTEDTEVQQTTDATQTQQTTEAPQVTEDTTEEIPDPLHPNMTPLL